CCSGTPPTRPRPGASAARWRWRARRRSTSPASRCPSPSGCSTSETSHPSGAARTAPGRSPARSQRLLGGGQRRPHAQVVGRHPGPPGDLGGDLLLQPAHDHRPVMDEQVVALVGHLGQQPALVDVGPEAAGRPPQHAHQRHERRLVRRTGGQGVHRGLDLVVDVVEEHRLLGREVAEERAPADVGSLRDGVDRRLREPLFREQGQGGIDDRRPGAIHVPFPEPWHSRSIVPAAAGISRHGCRLALKSTDTSAEKDDMNPSALTPAGADPEAHHRRWIILGVLCTSLLLVMQGNTALNLALPKIAESIGLSQSAMQWIVDAYSLVFAGLLFTTSTVGDRFGRKGVMQAGLVLFGLASGYAAFGTQTASGLIAARAVMGLAGAMIMPSTLSILTNVFPASERAKAIAVWAGIAGGGAAVGMILNG